MSANFFVFGLSIIAFAFGLYRALDHPSRLATLFFSIAGLGMFAQGLFPTDLPSARETASGAIHNLLSLPIIFGLILAYAFTANALRKEPGWFWHALLTALMPAVVLGITFVFVTSANEPGEPLYGISGLLQRALFTLAFGWITLTAGRLIEGHRRQPIQWTTHSGDDKHELRVANTAKSRGEKSWR